MSFKQTDRQTETKLIFKGKRMYVCCFYHHVKIFGMYVCDMKTWAKNIQNFQTFFKFSL